MGNNIDIVSLKLKQLKQALRDPTKSVKDLEKMIDDMGENVKLASNEIQINYEQISKRLTDEMNGKSSKRE
jgi:phosphotransferase system IIB component